jgi:isoaspartyl peptidase/L-asparaginase-like protein (Ntn-hydrolase superfamily)
VSSGAHAFAVESRLDIIDPELMISSSARSQYLKWRQRYVSETSNAHHCSQGMYADLSDRQDTVGAIVWNAENDIAAGVSRLESVIS